MCARVAELERESGRQAAELEALSAAHSPGASDRTPWLLAGLASVAVVVLVVALVVVLLGWTL